LVYYDPWLARVFFPIVYTLGFFAIGFLCKPNTVSAGRSVASVRPISLAVLLLGLEMVWLFLIAVAIFCRGPTWNFYWPWEEWDPHLVVPLNKTTLSRLFWDRLNNQSWEDMAWYVREIPGLLLAAGYLLLCFLGALSLSRKLDPFISYCWL